MVELIATNDREKNIQIEIPLLLPTLSNEEDRCISNLEDSLQERKGIIKVHVKRDSSPFMLCVHYDPNITSLKTVQRTSEEIGAKISERYQHRTFKISNMDCAVCATSIEHILGRVNGVLNVTVNYAAEKIWVEYDSQHLKFKSISKRIENLGYQIEGEDTTHTWIRKNWRLSLSIASGIFLSLGVVSDLLFKFPEIATILIYCLSSITGGYEAARHGIKAALNLRFDVDFLMIVAAIGAAYLDQWFEGALLLFLFSFGHSLEYLAMDRARHAIRALEKLAPRSARIIRENIEIEVNVDQLKRGDLVIVRAGERIPVDGLVEQGLSLVDQSSITGESVLVEKTIGGHVYAGSINGEGILEVKVTKLAKDSTLSKVIRMVEEAQSQKSPTQQITDRFTSIFVPGALLGTLVVILVPPLVGWLSWQEAFLRGMTIIVAASPCALAIATPAAVLSGIALAARNGVLIKGGVHLENLGSLDAIAFDKTGTITHGKHQVVDILPVNGFESQEILRFAAAVESRSTHPLAKAILTKAQAEGLNDLSLSKNIITMTGHGIYAEIDGSKIYIGNLKFFESDNTNKVPSEIINMVGKLEEGGKTVIILRKNEKFIGVLSLLDQPRVSSRITFDHLKNLGIKTIIMLTGDTQRVAQKIAQEVGLHQYIADMLPDEKVSAIKDLLTKHEKVAMVGDGINDAPALATATVGIAMGASGADVALETADVALMADDLSKLPFAVGLSRFTKRIIHQNLFIALIVIALLIPSSLFGLATIGTAIILHESSTLLVVLNALRILGYDNPYSNKLSSYNTSPRS